MVSGVTEFWYSEFLSCVWLQAEQVTEDSQTERILEISEGTDTLPQRKKK